MSDSSKEPTRPRLGAGHIIPSLDAPREEVLQFIYDRLKEQGTYSFNDTQERCKYRLDSRAGSKIRCPVGWLIPDNLYSPIDMENASAGLIGEIIELPTAVLGLVDEIQREHDSSRSENISFSVFLENFKYQFLSKESTGSSDSESSAQRSEEE